MSIRSIQFFFFILALTVVVFAVAYFGGALLLPTASSDSSGNEIVTGGLVGSRAPDFDLPDIEGTHVRMSDFTDTPLIITFWSTWNSDALNQLQILDSFAADEKGRGLVAAIAIDSQEERSLARTYVRRGGYRLPTLVDSLGSVGDAYGVNSLPMTYFVDRSGIIREVVRGVVSKRQLVDKLEGILR